MVIDWRGRGGWKTGGCGGQGGGWWEGQRVVGGQGAAAGREAVGTKGRGGCGHGEGWFISRDMWVQGGGAASVCCALQGLQGAVQGEW